MLKYLPKTIRKMLIALSFIPLVFSSGLVYGFGAEVNIGLGIFLFMLYLPVFCELLVYLWSEFVKEEPKFFITPQDREGWSHRELSEEELQRIDQIYRKENLTLPYVILVEKGNYISFDRESLIMKLGDNLLG
jgi:hypothetical protein